jgi:hypothetical protein
MAVSTIEKAQPTFIEADSLGIITSASCKTRSRSRQMNPNSQMNQNSKVRQNS